MDSVKEADMVVVLDTGSTDSTREKLRARGAQVFEAVISPWRFDTARNVAMDCIPEDVDICVSNDLDEIFDPGWRQKLEDCWGPETTRARYRFLWENEKYGYTELEYPMEKIHLRHGFRWIHPVHEILHYSEGPESVAWAEGVVLHHYPDHGKPRGQYLPLLELAAEENPGHGQTIFWLGREYFFNGHEDKAIETLTRHLGISESWDVERCASARYIARIWENRGDKAQAEKWYYRAIAECPTAREPYFGMAMLAYGKQDWPLTLAMVDKMLSISFKASGYLTNLDCWGVTPYDLGAISCYWLGAYQRSYDYGLKALEMEPGDQRLAENVRLAAAKLGLPH